MYSRLLLPLVAGLVGGFVAHRRGRDVLLWSLLCAVFPPAMVVLIVLPPKFRAGRNKICPHCSRVIDKGEVVCRHCGRELPIEMVRCPHCGNFVPDKEFCINCTRTLR